MSEGSWEDQDRRQSGHGVIALSQEADSATTALAPSLPVTPARAIAIGAPNKRHGVSCVRGGIHGNDNDNNDRTTASNHETSPGNDDPHHHHHHHHHHDSSSQIFRFEPDDGDGGNQDNNLSRTRANNRVFRVRTIEWVGLQRELLMLANTSTTHEAPHDGGSDAAATATASVGDDGKGARARPRQIHDHEGSDYDADDERVSA